MATEERQEKLDWVMAQRQTDLTVFAESLHKARNFSAIVRTCDAVGINELHAVPGEDGLRSIPMKACTAAASICRNGVFN